MATWLFQVYDTTWVTIAGELLFIKEKLNGSEEASFRVPNTVSSRYYAEKDPYVDCRISFNSVVIFYGVITGGNYSQDYIDFIIYNKVYEKANRTLFGDPVTLEGDYSAGATDTTILGAICTKGGWTAGTTSGTSRSLYFDKASCMDALWYLSQSNEMDFYTGNVNARGTNPTTINFATTRGTSKGALSPIIVSDHTYDRAIKRDGVYVISVDNEGNRSVGTSSVVGDYQVAYREAGQGSNVTTLESLAEKRKTALNTDTIGTKINVAINIGYNVYPGDTVSLDLSSIKLPSGTYRVIATNKTYAMVTLEVNRTYPTVEDMLKDLNRLGDMGIFPIDVTAGHGNMGWSSDVAFTYGADSHDDVLWSAGTIIFANGDTQAIDSGGSSSLAVGSHYVYWTYGSTTLTVTETIADGVGEEVGIIARLTVPTSVTESMMIEVVNSHGAGLGPEFDAPAAPTDLIAGDVVPAFHQELDGSTHSYMTVTITPVTVPITPTYYALRWRVDGTTAWVALQSATNVILMDGLVSGMDYEIQAACIGKLGGFSAWSNSPTPLHVTALGDTTAPAVPTGLTCTSKNVAVFLNWNANTELDLNHYKVYISHVLVAIVSSNTFLYMATSAQINVALAFSVSAVDNSGNYSAECAQVNGTPVYINQLDLNIEMRNWTSDFGMIWDYKLDALDPKSDFDGLDDGNDWDHIAWGKGGSETTADATITFGDTAATTKTITRGVDNGGWGDGTHYCYWTTADSELHHTTNYSVAVGKDKGLIAIVQINAMAGHAPTMIPVDSYTPVIGAGIIAAYAILTKHLTAGEIYGKDIMTDLNTGYAGGSAGLRMTGPLADSVIAGTNIKDWAGNLTPITAGFYGFKAGPVMTFKIDPTTGVFQTYGTGNFSVHKADTAGTKAGSLDGTEYDIDSAGLKPAIELHATTSGGIVSINANGDLVTFQQGADIKFSDNFVALTPGGMSGVSIGKADRAFDIYLSRSAAVSSAYTPPSSYPEMIIVDRPSGAISTLYASLRNELGTYVWARIGDSNGRVILPSYAADPTSTVSGEMWIIE